MVPRPERSTGSPDLAYNRISTWCRLNTERTFADAYAERLIVLTERMEHVHSVAMASGSSRARGARRRRSTGISHFVSTCSQGTRSRRRSGCSRDGFDRGNLDAFTSKETICFNVKSLADHVPIALDVLSDHGAESDLCPARTSSARGVILEEIKIPRQSRVLGHSCSRRALERASWASRSWYTETVAQLGHSSSSSPTTATVFTGEHGVLSGETWIRRFTAA